MTPTIVCISICLHIALNTKLFLFEREEEKRSKSLQLGTFNSPTEVTQTKPKEDAQEKHFDKSLINLSVQCIYMIAITLIFLALQSIGHFALSVTQEGKDAGYMLLFKIIAMHTVTGGFYGIYYWRNGALRDFLQRKINIFLQKNSTTGKHNDTVSSSQNMSLKFISDVNLCVCVNTYVYIQYHYH